MSEKEKTSASKFLSLVLRHKPEKIGILLDENGWADTSALLAGMNRSGRRISMDDLKEIVATCSKQRFKLSDDRSKIRANQGHSISVDVEMSEMEPPAVLYHGTATRFLDAIKKDGLIPKGRLHVHLSVDIETALAVGKRHGKPAILTINAAKMQVDGHKFYLSDNNVWLTSAIPPNYCSIIC